jgi:hypothetical protein
MKPHQFRYQTKLLQGKKILIYLHSPLILISFLRSDLTLFHISFLVFLWWHIICFIRIFPVHYLFFTPEFHMKSSLSSWFHKFRNAPLRNYSRFLATKEQTILSIFPSFVSSKIMTREYNWYDIDVRIIFSLHFFNTKLVTVLYVRIWKWK